MFQKHVEWPTGYDVGSNYICIFRQHVMSLICISRPLFASGVKHFAMVVALETFVSNDNWGLMTYMTATGNVNTCDEIGHNTT